MQIPEAEQRRRRRGGPYRTVRPEEPQSWEPESRRRRRGRGGCGPPRPPPRQELWRLQASNVEFCRHHETHCELSPSPMSIPCRSSAAARKSGTLHNMSWLRWHRRERRCRWRNGAPARVLMRCLRHQCGNAGCAADFATVRSPLGPRGQRNGPSCGWGARISPAASARTAH